MTTAAETLVIEPQTQAWLDELAAGSAGTTSSVRRARRMPASSRRQACR